MDLRRLRGSGPDGLVTRDDVVAAAETGAPDAPGTGRDRPAEQEQPVRTPVRGVRRATAEAMVASAFTAPHVTEMLDVDVTGSLELLDRLRARRDMADVPVTFLLLVARAFLAALRRHPEANATFDAEAQEVVQHPAVNLGIAAATPRGLLVPNVKRADRLDLPDLARALADLVATAREGRTAPQDLRGGTATLTNVGVFGVDTGTPILNPGESVILCLGQVRERPWVVDGALAVRPTLSLSLRPPAGGRRARLEGPGGHRRAPGRPRPRARVVLRGPHDGRRDLPCAGARGTGRRAAARGGGRRRAGRGRGALAPSRG